MSKLLIEVTQQIKDSINGALVAWQEANTPAKIKKETLKKLEEHKQHILLKLLGFDSQYGREWKLDHCNGRSGNSPIGTKIAKVQEDAINEWITSNFDIKEILEPVIKTIMAEFKDKHKINYTIRQHLNEKIAAAINNTVDGTVNTLIQTELKEIQNQIDLEKILSE